MSYERLPYDDAATTAQMHDDCCAADEALRVSLPRPRTAAEQVARLATGPAPSIRFEDFPRELAKREIRITEAAQRLAAAFDRD